ncbi:MAG: ABC transporter ATP-binding protein [Simkaniaceae bacterium]
MHPTPLYVSKLTKDYNSFRAVDNLSFEIFPGEIFGLLGPNGAGKTTTISMITTLEKPTFGTIKIFGKNILAQAKEAKSMMGVVPQELINHGYFSVWEIMKIHSSYFGLWKNEAKITHLLKMLDLWTHRNKFVTALSGGMKRRLLIAKALVHDPKLLLLDEPTAGVDIELRSQMWKFVKELRNQGLSILLTTHYLEEAEKLCDRIGILHHGRLRALERTKTIIEKMTHREVLIILNEPFDLKSEYLIERKKDALLFHIPRNFSLRDLLNRINLPIGIIRDIEVRDGNLEDAFQVILEDKHE